MEITLGSILIWGFVATIVLTLIQSAGQGLRLTRMSIPFLLGTALTTNLDRSAAYGFIIHFLNGWGFSAVYAIVFVAWGQATWWQGLLLGLLNYGARTPVVTILAHLAYGSILGAFL